MTVSVRRYDRLRRPERPADFIEFVPGSTDPWVVADISARINWYLADRTVPVYMEGAAGLAIGADDAPHMDPALVRDPGWERSRPQGQREVVVHDVNPSSLIRALVGRRGAFASSTFSAEAERGWFDLQRRYGTTRPPEAHISAERLLSRAQTGATAYVLATGPSAQLVDPDSITAELRITCNSAVRDSDLLTRFAPDVIAFADPVFHCGPSRYAAAFRADLLKAIELTNAVLLSSDHWINPVIANCPQLAERLAVVTPRDQINWRWPTRQDFSVRTTSNVLTLLMLPAAFALADSVEVAGCDGRRTEERYFWRHNPATQYTDALMQSVFASHPAFFRDRNYADYYEQHCDELELSIAAAERAGKHVRGVTPSHIPALVHRGAHQLTT